MKVLLENFIMNKYTSYCIFMPSQYHMESWPSLRTSVYRNTLIIDIGNFIEMENGHTLLSVGPMTQEH